VGDPVPPDLDVLWRAYLRRYDIEQLFRFLKQTLNWTTPQIRTPAQHASPQQAGSPDHLVLRRKITGEVGGTARTWPRIGAARPTCGRFRGCRPYVST